MKIQTILLGLALVLPVSMACAAEAPLPMELAQAYELTEYAGITAGNGAYCHFDAGELRRFDKATAIFIASEVYRFDKYDAPKAMFDTFYKEGKDRGRMKGPEHGRTCADVQADMTRQLPSADKQQ